MSRSEGKDDIIPVVRDLSSCTCGFPFLHWQHTLILIGLVPYGGTTPEHIHVDKAESEEKKNSHKMVTIFTSLLRLQNVFIIAHHLPLSLEIFKHKVFFSLLDNLNMFENFASLHCMRIYNNKYRSQFFLYLPILLKVDISVYSMYIQI